MRLLAGQKAPPLQAVDIDGRPVVVPPGDRKLWLAFFRYAACPFCNLRVAEIGKHAEQLERLGIDVVAVVQSPAKNIQKYMGQGAPRLRFVADPQQALYRAYHVEKSLAGMLSPRNRVYARQLGAWKFHPEGSLRRLPADFLIQPDGTLADVFYASIIAEHIPWDRVWHFAGSAQL